jgi:hypothetical protein
MEISDKNALYSNNGSPDRLCEEPYTSSSTCLISRSLPVHPSSFNIIHSLPMAILPKLPSHLQSFQAAAKSSNNTTRASTSLPEHPQRCRRQTHSTIGTNPAFTDHSAHSPYSIHCFTCLLTQLSSFETPLLRCRLRGFIHALRSLPLHTHSHPRSRASALIHEPSSSVRLCYLNPSVSPPK